MLGAIAGSVACEGLDDFACCRALCARTGVPEPEQIAKLPSLPVRHKAVCGKADMAQAVLDAVCG